MSDRELIIIAIGAIVISLTLSWAWRRVRTLTRKVARLPLVERELAASRERESRTLAELMATRDASTRRAREYASVLAETTEAAVHHLEQVQLPLHILLDSRFGDLNENQEEMLAGARASAEQAEVALGRLRSIAELDQGALTFRLESVRLSDVIDAVLPSARAQAAREGVKIIVDLGNLPPRVSADRARLKDAIHLLLSDCIRYSVPGSAVAVDADFDPEHVRVKIRHDSLHEPGSEVVLAQRLIAVQGGSVDDADGVITVTLPRDGVVSPR